MYQQATSLPKHHQHHHNHNQSQSTLLSFVPSDPFFLWHTTKWCDVVTFLCLLAVTSNRLSTAQSQMCFRNLFYKHNLHSSILSWTVVKRIWMQAFWALPHFVKHQVTSKSILWIAHFYTYLAQPARTAQPARKKRKMKCSKMSIWLPSQVLNPQHNTTQSTWASGDLGFQSRSHKCHAREGWFFQYFKHFYTLFWSYIHRNTNSKNLSSALPNLCINGSAASSFLSTNLPTHWTGQTKTGQPFRKFTIQCEVKWQRNGFQLVFAHPKAL